LHPREFLGTLQESLKKLEKMSPSQICREFKQEGNVAPS
jgi:hypothetical protein